MAPPVSSHPSLIGEALPWKMVGLLLVPFVIPVPLSIEGAVIVADLNEVVVLEFDTVSAIAVVITTNEIIVVETS